MAAVPAVSATGLECTFQRLGKLLTVPQQPHHSYTSYSADEMSSSKGLVPTLWGPGDSAFPRSLVGTEMCQVSTHGPSCPQSFDPRAGREVPMSGNSREAQLSPSGKLALFMSSELSYPRKHKVLCFL